MIDYEAALMANSTEAIGVILTSIKAKPSPYYMEYKLQLLKKFIPWMTYTKVDDLLQIFHKLAKRAHSFKNGLIVSNTNPFMVLL